VSWAKAYAVVALLILLAMVLAGCSLFNSPTSGSASGSHSKRGQVTIYRGHDIYAEDIQLTVREDETVIGILKDGTYLRRYAKPGRHYYSAVASAVLYDTRDEHDDHGEHKKGSHNEGEFVQVESGGRYFVQAIPQHARGRVEVRVYLMFEADALPVISIDKASKSR